MRRLYTLCLLGWAVVGLGLLSAQAKVFTLFDGSTVQGEVSAADDNGVIFRLDSGGFSHQVTWGKFTQKSLKELAKDPKIRRYVEPFIEIPPEKRPKPKPVILRPVPHVERPLGRTSILSSFTTPIGLFIFALLYLGNLFAAYEVANYRNRPVSMVCGLSALLPFLGPIIFLASPGLEEHPVAEAPSLEEAVLPPPPVPGVGPSGSQRITSGLGHVGVPPPPEGGGLRVAAGQTKANAAAGPKIYNRSEVTFNRRFIETQFSGFFRMVPTDAERDMVLVVKTPKHEYIARRVTRISAADMFLQPIQMGSKEVRVTFGEISQIVLRHKDDHSAQ